jgi:hypothetical protein
MRRFDSRSSRRRRRRRSTFPRGTFGRRGPNLSFLRDLPGNLTVTLAGIGLYIFFLIFGVTVVGDNAGRSAIMAGIIVAIAACGYVFTRQPSPNKDK